MQQRDTETISADIVRMQAAEQPSREAVRQSIVDRVAEAFRVWHEEHEAAQKACDDRLDERRAAIQADCAKLGHLFSSHLLHRSMGTRDKSILKRRCVYCSAVEA